MTLKIPEENFADKVLALLGKERAIHIPGGVYERFGPYVIVQARRETFWRALRRTKNEEPPAGWFYPIK